MSLVLIMVFCSLQSFADNESKVQTINIVVTDKGFEPSTVSVAPNQDVKLRVTRKTDSTCATSIQVPDKKLKKALPLNQTVELDLGTLKKGQIKFGCQLDMMESGKIVVK